MSSLTEHSFTLYFDGADPRRDDHCDAIYEAGCDDALVGSDGTGFNAGFIRAGTSFTRAVFSAIHDLESSVPGLRVTRIESDELVPLSVIARRTGRSRESIRLLAGGQRGPGDFPAAVDYVDGPARMWSWSEVSAWFRRYEGNEPEAPGISQFARALNGVLEARRQLTQLADADPSAAATAASGLLDILAQCVTDSAQAPHAA